MTASKIIIIIIGPSSDTTGVSKLNRSRLEKTPVHEHEQQELSILGVGCEYLLCESRLFQTLIQQNTVHCVVRNAYKWICLLLFSVKHNYFRSCLLQRFLFLNFPCGEKFCWFRQTSYLSQASQAMLSDEIHTDRTNCRFLWKLYSFVTKYTNFHEHYTHFSGKCTHFGEHKCTFCCDFRVFYVKNTKIFGLLRKKQNKYKVCILFLFVAPQVILWSH